MALIACDGFDIYASIADVEKSLIYHEHSSNQTFSTTSGRYGGGCLVNSVASSAWVYPIGSQANGATIHFAFHYYCTARASGGATDKICQIFNAAAASLMHIEHNTSGDVKVYNSAGVQIGSTATAAIGNAAWHWIEVKVIFGTNDTTGTVVVQVNGVEIVNVGSIDTFTSSGISGRAQMLKFFGSGGGSRYDDIIVWDTTGSSFNSFPLGEMKIDTLAPNGDGTATDWTRSTGSTNSTLVDDVMGGSNGDTDYLSSSTAAHKTDLTMGNLSESPTSILAVVARSYARKTDAGNRTFRVNAKQSATVANGTEVGLTYEYCWRRVGTFYVDPVTTSAFTAANINSLQMQLELVS